ncbi:unnamed protein product [Gordionus sp. m RMFG-2023]|uniref:lysosomal acid lipase/cholesteryl ester hydrolase-like n=1 Tax=Gordionus sp. m RMFG-2023 TaxID=3053472 RepID=UPI0030E3E5BF
MITSKDYPYENYEIVAEDGFFLQLHRIPFGKNLKNTEASVYLQHGLLSTSCDFLMNLENQSLAYILAENGFDVWLGDIRGNTYSRKHKTFTSEDDEFWDWSFDEMARYDIPAFINFILKKTSREYLYYVGHSQGTMVAFAHFSQNPKISWKVKMFFALAPVAYLKEIKSPMRMIALMSRTLKLINDMFGSRKFMPKNALLEWMAASVCPQDIELCANMLYLIGGPETGNFNKSKVPVIYGHYPAGTSVKNIAHFIQGILNDDFRMYDYGFFKNLKEYGKSEPPSYDISQMMVPTMIFWGVKDWLADPEDVNKLIPKIKNLLGNYKFENSNHWDFIYGTNAANDYYSIIVKTMLASEKN